MEREVGEIGLVHTTFDPAFAEHSMDKDDPPFVLGGARLRETGIDEVEFYFSPNPGEEAKPLAKIASGGELSRLMLALKSSILSRTEIPTLLFDEVDAGIGGKVAEMVGRKLARVAETHQVLCVTHLPQIAALARDHYVVEKAVSQGRTYTAVKKLSKDERIEELARMLGGTGAEHARRHAEAMLKAHVPGSGG
jgi:DNA repair protein RecN (Recombination protein N)